MQNVYNTPQPGTSKQISEPGTSRQIPEPGTSKQIPEPITTEQSPQPQPSTSRHSPQPSTSTQLPSTNSLEQLNNTGTSVQYSNHERETVNKLIEIESAFNKRLVTYACVNFESENLKTVLFNLISNIKEKLSDAIKKFTSIKFNLFLECEFENIKKETTLHNFKSKNQALFRSSDITKSVISHLNKLLREYEESTLKGSGWYYLKVHKFELRISENVPLFARGHMLLPKQFAHCKSLINIKNMDDYCFKYCILSKYVNENKDLWISYLNKPDLEAKYDWSCINFPTSLNDISKFEKINNVSVNVFGIEQKIQTYNGRTCFTNELFPLKVCEEQRQDHHDLLLVSNEQNSHYVVI